MLDASKNREAGFSLMELLVSIVISGIVLGAIATAFSSQSKSYDAQEDINEMHQNTRAAMDMMTREIRMAGYDPTDVGIVGIPDASKLEIHADLDSDGATTGSHETIIYSYDPVKLQILRNAGGTDEVLAENVQDFNFDYKDNDGNSTGNPADIRQVEITIKGRTAGIDPDYPDNGGYRTYTLAAMITPRNLAY